MDEKYFKFYTRWAAKAVPYYLGMVGIALLTLDFAWYLHTGRQEWPLGTPTAFSYLFLYCAFSGGVVLSAIAMLGKDMRIWHRVVVMAVGLLHLCGLAVTVLLCSPAALKYVSELLG